MEAQRDPGEATTPFSPTLFEGRTAIVTGGAGAVGGALCTLLARHGCDVVCADIAADRVAAVVAQVREAGRTGVAVVADLRTAEGMAELERSALGAFARIDILINGVGENLDSWGPFEDSNEATWQALYEVNLLHVLRACHRFVPVMRRHGWGRILNFSSVEGIRAAPWLAVYTAFKRAVDAFTKSLAVDVARHGILVNAIALDKVRAYQSNHYALPDEYLRLVETWIPAGRYGEPADAAAIALFLASPLNRWIVGQTIVADGGTLAAGGWYRTTRRWTNQPLLVQHLEPAEVNEQRPKPLQ
jgi:NAD(P)-dependent dehydrogenase (short-subunit alcohol dehydrogenase family)